MSTKPELTTINIRPGVAILSVLRHLNYRPWFAMAEFVDNSLQSYLEYKDALEEAEGKDFKLQVHIELDAKDGGRLIIRDNAAGIHNKDYPRAFRPAEAPTDNRGLSEFGIGMKSAACWFAKRWSVRTSALGEATERTVTFNIAKIVQDKLDELSIDAKLEKAKAHYTEIVLEDLHQPPQGRTVGKIKEHLASIFRVFLRKGVLELYFDGDKLEAPDVKVLKAAHYKAGGEPIEWLKDINFDLGKDMKVYGFAAIRETASTSDAGFALFRRNRLIQGSGDDGYRPEKIFGKSNSFRFQRLFGELHLDGFEVSHTKDGFRWDENEDPFLDLLKDHLNSKPMPLLDQAEEYRVRLKAKDLRPAAETAAENTADAIEKNVPPVFAGQMDAKPESGAPPSTLPHSKSLASTRVMDVEMKDEKWRIVLELTNDPAISDWLTVSDKPQGKAKDAARQLSVRVSLVHPFMERFAGADATKIEPLVRVAAAIAISEVAARESGVKLTGTMRRNINQLLKDALSKP